jgi:hypothetical protein
MADELNKEDKAESKKTNSRKAPRKPAAEKMAAPKKKDAGRKEKIMNMTKEVLGLITEEIKERAGKEIISQEEEKKFIDTLTEKFKKSKEEFRIFTTIIRLKLEIASLKKALPDKFRKLGEKAYQLVGRKELSSEALAAAVEAVRVVEQKVSQMEKEIEDLRKTAKEIIE